MGHRGDDAVHEDGEQERVDGRAGGLVEQHLDSRVADVEPRLYEVALRGFAVEGLLVTLGGGRDGFLGWRGVVGRERLFEEVLPGRKS